MKYEAIIFDLFGTLVDNLPVAPFHACLSEMAGTLGIDSEHFIGLWASEPMIVDRMSGESPCMEAYLKLICSQLSVPYDQQRVADAKRIRTAFSRHSLLPREDAISTLSCLATAGYRVGLITNCTWEVPELWGTTPFAPFIEQPIFSCSAGMMKPDPRIYQLACDRLEVNPTHCLYVGDGSSRELTTAQQAGMDAMLMCAPYEREQIMQREDPRNWQGPVIERIADVLHYLDIPQSTVCQTIGVPDVQ